MALAIQTVAQRVRSKYKEKTVQDFKYRDKEWEQLFLDALSNVTFEGVTVGSKIITHHFHTNLCLLVENIFLLLLFSIYVSFVVLGQQDTIIDQSFLSYFT